MKTLEITLTLFQWLVVSEKLVSVSCGQQHKNESDYLKGRKSLVRSKVWTHWGEKNHSTELPSVSVHLNTSFGISYIPKRMMVEQEKPCRSWYFIFVHVNLGECQVNTSVHWKRAHHLSESWLQTNVTFPQHVPLFFFYSQFCKASLLELSTNMTDGSSASKLHLSKVGSSTSPCAEGSQASDNTWAWYTESSDATSSLNLAARYCRCFRFICLILKSSPTDGAKSIRCCW